MRRIVCLMFLLVFSGVASPQVFEQGGSQRSSANATVPTCTDSDGGAGFTQAAAACAADGYSAAASAQASYSSSPAGGSVSAFAEAEAGSTGSPSNFTATGLGDGGAVVTWTMVSNTHYSLSTTVSGGGSASLSDGSSGPLPPSGILPPDTYQLNADTMALAQAQDINGVEFVTAGPLEASARVSFAVVGSPTLILGTVLAGGAAIPGLLIEALAGGIVVASALSGDDGSYLLPDLPGMVVLRISDPAGGFATQFSGPLAPPATFNADLEPVIFADGFELP